jgi:phospholipase/carboxylesterase
MAGVSPEDAKAAVVMIHGRGATAESLLAMASDIGVQGVSYIAPQAAARTWYPNSFLAPVEQNEPGRSSGLDVIADILDNLQVAGISAQHTVLLGFSQGGCLASEFAARAPTRYGGVVALSGGLIGASIDETDGYKGQLNDTPVLLGCSDVDPHIPEERVHATGRVFESLGGDVDKRIYNGMGHTINEDEVSAVTALVKSAVD